MLSLQPSVSAVVPMAVHHPPTRPSIHPGTLCRPLLLEGPPGCGKTALLEHLAALTGNAQDMVQPGAGSVLAFLCIPCNSLCSPTMYAIWVIYEEYGLYMSNMDLHGVIVAVCSG